MSDLSGEASVSFDRDVVLTSRVRLARNYEDVPFSSHLSREWALETIRRATDAVAQSPRAREFRLLQMTELSPDERGRMVEHHLISYDLLKYAELSAVLLNAEETLSIMVNEEDHLRIQGLYPGLQLEKAAALAFEADDWLGAGSKYAFDQQWGFLTSCPTNTGTGMRASTMLHLPGLSMAGQMGAIVQAVSRLGLTVRGLYGEGSEAQGHLYQLSNQVTLGRTEEDTIQALQATTRQIADQERQIRDKLLQKDALLLEDQCMRSVGVLLHARLLNAKEFMQRYSQVRMGCCLGLVPFEPQALDGLMKDVQPSSLNVQAGRALNERDRDAHRADVTRQTMERLLRQKG